MRTPEHRKQRVVAPGVQQRQDPAQPSINRSISKKHGRGGENTLHRETPKGGKLCEEPQITYSSGNQGMRSPFGGSLCERGPQEAACESSQRGKPSRRRQWRRPCMLPPRRLGKWIQSPQTPVATLPGSPRLPGSASSWDLCPGPQPGGRVLTHLVQRCSRARHDLAPIQALPGLLEVLECW